jgi:hypothetical protein
MVYSAALPGVHTGNVTSLGKPKKSE